MRQLIVIILLVSCVWGRNAYTPDFFVKKHNLKLPSITKSLLDVSKHTYATDTWEYSYQGKTDRIDRVLRKLRLMGFPANNTVRRYSYSGDTTVYHSVSVAIEEGDTTSMREYRIRNAGLEETIVDPMSGCTTFVEFTDWGRRKLEKRKCPGDSVALGQEFSFEDHGDYVESIETRRGYVDSSTIRRLYFTSFDSLVADYFVNKDEPNALVKLRTYTREHKLLTEYGFSFFDNNNQVVRINQNEYFANGKLKRTYMFRSKDRHERINEYELINYTKYEYDSLGRLTRMVTRMVPDPKYVKTR